MRTLLACSDLSERSDRALARAVALARRHDAKLAVLLVVDEDLPPDLIAVMEDGGRERLKHRLAALDPDEHVFKEIRVARGPVHVECRRAALDVGADLIVLGTHRHRFIADLLHKPTVARIVHDAPAPVLIAADDSDEPYRRVLAGIDFAPTSCAALRMAAELAPGAEFHLFHAFHALSHRGAIGSATPYEDAARARMEGFLNSTELPTPASVTVEEGGPAVVAQERCAALSPDLIAIGAHARAHASEVILGSFAQDMVLDPPCDVLVWKDV